MKLNRVVAHVGSLRSTLAGLALLGVVIFARPTWTPLALVMGLLALNLAAAIVVHPAFRRRLPLLVAHLALLVLVLAAGLGRLLALDGRFELTEGVPFDGTLLDRASGVLHRERLSQLQFRHHGFEIDYAPGRKRGATRNAVSWVDTQGGPRHTLIGDHVPLVLEGHRFYTSPNKGFAPILSWLPQQGEPQRGAVHLPSYPVHELRQSQQWTLPDGREFWVMLSVDETLIPPARAASFKLPREHRLVVRLGNERHEVVPGQALSLPGGTLVYERLSTWMGYRVAYDPTLPWLLAASLLAAFALLWHYVVKFAAAPLPSASTVPTVHQAATLEWADG